MNAIQEIPIGCFLNFDYDENEIDRKNIDIQQCKILIEEWLHQNPRINDVIILFDTLEVQLLEFKNDVEHACLGGGGGTIKFDYRRLHADNSPLVKKATKYSSIIDKYNLP